jgi:hypothetical protein
MFGRIVFLECQNLIQNLTINNQMKAPKPLPRKWEFEYSLNVEYVEGYKFVTDQPATNIHRYQIVILH